jgi:hypothetical protein
MIAVVSAHWSANAGNMRPPKRDGSSLERRFLQRSMPNRIPKAPQTKRRLS